MKAHVPISTSALSRGDTGVTEMIVMLRGAMWQAERTQQARQRHTLRHFAHLAHCTHFCRASRSCFCIVRVKGLRVNG